MEITFYYYRPSWSACAAGRLSLREVSHGDYALLPASALDVSCIQLPIWSANTQSNFISTFTLALVIATTAFTMLSSWHSPCNRSPGSFDKCSKVLGSHWSLHQADWLEPHYYLPKTGSYSTTFTIAIYYYSAQKPILILQCHGG